MCPAVEHFAGERVNGDVVFLTKWLRAGILLQALHGAALPQGVGSLFPMKSHGGIHFWTPSDALMTLVHGRCTNHLITGKLRSFITSDSLQMTVYLAVPNLMISIPPSYLQPRAKV